MEEAAALLFQDASVARLDLDAAKKKGASQKILGAFRKGKTNILVGTQLVAKGLDFQNVGVVGIVAADVSLNIPDYRAAETTWQLIVQAAGRSGRGEEPGDVVIQTYSPDDRTIQTAAAGDYEAFYRSEIKLRYLSGYPPFTNIIRLVFSGEDEGLVAGEALAVFHQLEQSRLPSEGELFRPQPAWMSYLNGKHRYQVLIKSPVDRTKKYIELIEEVKKTRSSRSGKVIMIAELDPYSLT